MKTAFQVEKLLDYTCLPKPLLYDKLEIDNPNPFDLRCLNYIDRIGFVIEKIQELYPKPKGIRVAELGCAQGNMTILLGEKGYSITGIDINEEFIKYAKLKYEFGNVEWINSNFMNLDIDSYFDIVILGEILEHCAEPTEVISKSYKMLKKGGYAIITTPNGENIQNWSLSRMRRRLPTWNSFNYSNCKLKQFGPDAEDHLFLFKLSELNRLLLVFDFNIIEKGYVSGNIILNSLIKRSKKMLSLGLIKSMIRKINQIPLLDRYFSNNIYFIAQKIKIRN